MPGSAADKGGIQEADVITEINGVAINNFPELRVELAKYEAQASIDVKVMHQHLTPEQANKLSNKGD